MHGRTAGLHQGQSDHRPTAGSLRSRMAAPQAYSRVSQTTHSSTARLQQGQSQTTHGGHQVTQHIQPGCATGWLSPFLFPGLWKG